MSMQILKTAKGHHGKIKMNQLPDTLYQNTVAR
jgi:hypothetical protein